MPARQSISSRKRVGQVRRSARKPDKRSSKFERRIGAESSKTRALLLEAAERLMREEGYAAVTSRRLATKAGLKRQLVHYYFRTMDDLFLALWRRYAEKILLRQAQALSSSQPLHALWDHSSDAWDTSLYTEFCALANHRKAIRAELAQTGDRYRTMQLRALAQIVEDYGLESTVESPDALTMLITSVPRILVMEAQLGISGGHELTMRLAERWLARLEGPRGRPATKRKA